MQTKLSPSKITTIINKLNKETWFNKTTKPRITERGYSGTTRIITINIIEAKKYLNEIQVPTNN